MTVLVRALSVLFSVMLMFSVSLTRAEDQPADKEKLAEKKADSPAEKPVKKPADKPAKKKDEKKADSPPPATPAATEPAKPAVSVDIDAIAKFEKKMADWKNLLKDLRSLQTKAQAAPAGELPALQKQWDDLIGQGNKLLPEMRELGKAAYLALPNADRSLIRFLLKQIEDELARDDYEPALELAQLLIDNNCDEKSIYNSAGIAAFATGAFDKAEEYFKLADEAKVLAGDGLKHNSFLAEYKTLWTKEAEIRKAEAEKNDLPRVKVTTSQGDILLELFENEAPEAVGNFVSLVEAKFYDNKNFHRVLQGFMAQGGCPKGDGTGGPGYQIYCESQKENARMHFRGSLSMAHAGRDTGGSQFFLTFVPTPNLNGKHTVFGRVIEGLDVLAKLQRIDPQGSAKVTPDKIVKAEVLRKREHKYEPNKVK